MIKVEHIEVFNFDGAIRGCRNPLNSWAKSDSGLQVMNPGDVEFGYEPNYEYIIGENDLALMRKLCRAGSDHRKFLRQIMVSMDITAPRYWWEQFATYRVGVVQNSTSTMHTIHKKPFTLDDFSCENLDGNWSLLMYGIRDHLNFAREKFIETGDEKYWWQMIQLLPQSYNQKRTVTLNYEVLLNMYHARRNHRLDEWRTFCEVIETMPYAKELICNVD